jgi:hypothetical protein
VVGLILLLLDQMGHARGAEATTSRERSNHYLAGEAISMLCPTARAALNRDVEILVPAGSLE